MTLGSLSRRPSRGFTLVELMVAVTGGLFVSLAVFALASDGSRFYRRESRVADATLSTIVGFERLRMDVARAGFLSSPNVRRDPRVCGTPATDPSWPAELSTLAALRIVKGGSPANTTLTANGIAADSLVLSGSYTSPDQFPIWNVQSTGAMHIVYLQANIGPLARMGYSSSTNQAALLSSVFGVGRGMRIQDPSGELQFGTIRATNAGAIPQVILANQPSLTYRQTAGATCGLKGNVTGAVANVLNFVRYDLRNLSSSPATPSATSAYAPAYGDSLTAEWDGDRTDLVRVELDTGGTAIDGTEELVAEYAVDFRLGLTVISGLLNSDPTLSTLLPEDAAVGAWTDVLGVNPTIAPQRIRSVRVRLAVRTREPDREENVTAALVPGLAGGLYRIGLGPSAGAPFARVRTMQADVALHNQAGVLW